MKKRIIALTLGLTLGLSGTVFAQDVKVKLDNEYINFNQQSGYPFVDQNNRTQVPFRATLEAFKANVNWDNETRTAIAGKEDTTVRVPVGQSFIYKNNEKVENDTVALIKEGRTYLPIRVVMESFGAKVGWESDTKTVLIKTNEKVEKPIEKPIEKPEVPKQEEIKSIEKVAQKEALSKYVAEDKGRIEYRIENRYERVPFVYKIKKSDLPVKIGDCILYDIKPNFEQVGKYNLDTIVIEQKGDLYLNIANKDYSVLRPRNQWHSFGNLIETIEYGKKVKSHYGIVTNDLVNKDWKTYDGSDAYHLMFNDSRTDYAVIIENAFGK
jgi:hypothetical protein